MNTPSLLQRMSLERGSLRQRLFGQPHITIQNNAPKAKADQLYHEMGQSFRAYDIEITGLDLWEYLGGPWRQATFALFLRQK